MKITYQVPQIITDSFILEFFFKGDKVNPSIIKASYRYPQIIDYLNNRFKEKDESLIETIYRIKNGIEIKPTCKYCDKKLKYRGQGNYGTYCSLKCAQNDNEIKEKKDKTLNQHLLENPDFKKEIIQKRIQTNLSKYGREHFTQTKEFLQKSQQTTMKHYGVNFSAQSPICLEKMKQTCLEKYGVDHNFKIPEVKQQIIETNIQNYNVENVFSSPEIIKRCKQIRLERYGDEYYNNREKCKQTCLEKYGVEYSFLSENNKQKSKETCLEKYGVTSYPQSQQHKDYMHYLWDNNLIQDKIYDTKSKNKSFNTSKIEQDLIKYFNDNKINFHYQYKSEKYPFYCDFYLIDYDLYLEIQGSWTHGKQPFDEHNIEDQMLLNKWKEKSQNSIFYKNAIEVWTLRDPLKRTIAKNNGLNFLEIFSINLNEIINKINEFVK